MVRIPRHQQDLPAMLSWFDSEEATGVGAALARDVASTATVRMRRAGPSTSEQNARDLRRFLQKVGNDAGSLRLNLYKKARLAGSFKAKLLESGIEPALAEDLTQLLLTQLASEQLVVDAELATPTRHKRPDFRQVEQLLAEGHEFAKRGEHRNAANAFEQAVTQMPGSADALHGLGAALSQLSAYPEAEKCFRRAIAVQPDHAEALCNLGAALYSRGEYPDAENFLRRAIKARPAFVQAQCNLASVLIAQARMSDAEALLSKVLRSSPRDADALLCMGRVIRLNGRFDEARTFYMRALESKPKMPAAWAALAAIRRMTAADSEWLRGAEEILAGSIDAQQEAELRFAMGKYFDDVEDYERAFKNYQRANQLQRKVVPRYDHQARQALVTELIGAYSRESLRGIGLRGIGDGAVSSNPLFVVGMMRSGTSLVEQIIATHPRATGAGELTFWIDAYRQHEAQIRAGKLSEAARKELAERYVRLLRTHGAGSKLVVDKANMNSDCLGLIHSVFPAARFIHVERHPIDTCLSCYFQQLAPSLSHSFDLADLAHYFRQHQRLMRHWKEVLPAGSLLEVPYAELVANKEHWIRRILDFAGLDWQPQCLNFHQTSRPVKTASAWQVRQQMYGSSVGRWRHYEKFLGPLRSLVHGS
jgi:tetratricopeptide (TPR) repeat protein